MFHLFPLKDIESTATLKAMIVVSMHIVRPISEALLTDFSYFF